MSKINLEEYKGAFKRGDVARLRELNHILAYSQVGIILQGLSFNDVPSDRIREVVEFLLSTARLRIFSFVKMIPVFGLLREDTEFMTKIIFSRVGSRVELYHFLEWCEEFPATWGLIDLIGAAGLLTGKIINRFTGSFHQKLKHAAYQQVLTSEQVELRIIFESNMILPHQIGESNRWMIANADIMDLALSPEEILNAIFMGDFDREASMTLLERLTPQDRKVLFQDLTREFNYLSTIKSSKSEDSTRSLLNVLQLSEEPHDYDDVGVERIATLLRDEDYASMIFTMAASSACSDQTMKIFLHWSGYDHPLVKEHLRLMGDQCYEEIKYTSHESLSIHVQGRLMKIIVGDPRKHLEMILMWYIREKNYLIHASLRPGSHWQDRVRLDEASLRIDRRHFILEDGPIAEVLPNIEDSYGIATEEKCPCCDGESEADLIMLKCEHHICTGCIPELLKGCPHCKKPSCDLKLWKVDDLVKSIMS